MKTHKLVIENNRIKINEVEVSIDQILKTTGVKETAKFLNQVGKYISANIKLVAGIVFSFRSFSLKKISENINGSSKKFASRVRFAMRNIDSDIDVLTSDSKINEAFMYTQPILALVDTVRKEVDNAGGLYNYLTDYNQNFFIGDVTADIFDMYELGIQKAMGFESKSSSNKNESSRLKKAKRLDLVKRKFRENFGERAEDLVLNIYKGKSTPDTDKFIDIVENKAGLSDDDHKKEILDFLNSLKETKNIKLFSLLLESKPIQNKKDLYKKALLILAEIMSIESIIFNNLFDNEVIIKNNVKNDIEEFSCIIEILLADFLIYNMINEYTTKKSLSFNKIKEEIKKYLPDKIDNDVQNRINVFVNKLEIEVKNINEEEEIVNLLLSLIAENKENRLYENQKFKEYIKKLEKYCNSDLKEFKDIKKSANLLYEHNIKFSIQEAERILTDLVNTNQNEN